MRKLKYNRTAKDAYAKYAKKLLEQHQGWWGKYEQKQQNFRIYKLSESGKVIEMMSYPRFKSILDTWFKGAKTYIINGRSLAMGNSLGRLLGVRVERNFKKKTIDWKATKAMWERNGERKGHVYFTDDEWMRIGWQKTTKVKWMRFYQFTPAEGNTKSNEGFKKAFTLAHQKDPLLRYQYEYKPFIRETT